MQWQEIIEFLGGASLFAAVIAFLGQKAVDAYVTGRVEAYKGELQRLTAEHAVRFQRLHAERADAVRDLYAQLAELDESLASTLAPFQAAVDIPLSEKILRLSDQFNGLREFFLPRRIYLDEKLCGQIEVVLGFARGIFFDITAYEVEPRHPQYKYNPEILKDRHEFWERARSAHKTDFTALKSALENEFRMLLGIGV